MIDYRILAKLLRTAATDAIPDGIFSEILYDALDKDATPRPERTASITAEIAEAKQVSFGKKRVRVDGAVIIRMYEPDGKGDGTQIAHATTICNNLHNLKMTEEDSPGTYVTVQFGLATPLNAVRTGPQWERTIRAPFKATLYLN